MLGKAWAILALPRECPNSGDGERCGEVGWGVGEGVRASGDRGMLPADFRRPERYLCPLSLGARPWSVLGRMCPDPAGELGALELGELLWEELVPAGRVGEGRQGCEHPSSTLFPSHVQPRLLKVRFGKGQLLSVLPSPRLSPGSLKHCLCHEEVA